MILFPTHFVCLPLVTSSSREILTNAITQLKTIAEAPEDQDLRQTGQSQDDSPNEAHASSSRPPVISGITPRNPTRLPAKAIRPADTLHLTIATLHHSQLEKAAAVLSILDLESLLQAAAVAASAVVESAKCQASAPEPLCVSLDQVKSMNTRDPRQSAVVYAAPLDKSGRLQLFCESIRDIFNEKLACLPDQRPLLLHATLINTRYLTATDFYKAGGIKASIPFQSNDKDKAKEDSDKVNPGSDAEIKQESTEKLKSNRPPIQRRKKKARLLYDATNVLNYYSSQTFTRPDQAWRVENVAICKMGATKYYDNSGKFIKEAYEVLHERALP
jgi:activating signal cointegrator complex subunit 1